MLYESTFRKVPGLFTYLTQQDNSKNAMEIEAIDYYLAHHYIKTETWVNIATYTYNRLLTATYEGSNTTHLPDYTVTDQKNIRIIIYEINIGLASYVKHLDKHFKEKEIKGLSLMLQNSKTNYTRVYKEDNYFFIVTSTGGSTDAACKIVGTLPAFYEEFEDTKDIAIDIGNANLDSALTKILKLLNAPELKEKLILDNYKKLIANLPTAINTQAVQLRDRLKRDVQDIETELTNTYKSLRNVEITLATAASTEEEQKTLLNYLLRNPYIQHIAQHNTDLVVEYKVPMSCNKNDAPLIRKSYKNHTYKRAIQELFENDRYKLWWECTIILKLSNKTVTRGVADNSKLENTHIMRYNCFGNNKTPIEKALIKNDILTALNICSHAASNLNLMDGTVITTFFDKLYNYSHCGIVQTSEDTWISIQTLENLLKEKENKENGTATKVHE